MIPTPHIWTGLQLLLPLNLLLTPIVPESNISLLRRLSSGRLVLNITRPQGSTDRGSEGEEDRSDGDQIESHGDGSETDTYGDGSVGSDWTIQEKRGKTYAVYAPRLCLMTSAFFALS
jgi:hypothetical protein